MDAERWRLLERAKGRPELQALFMVDLVFSQVPEARRENLKQALEALAIPHWCDARVLATLLDAPTADSSALLADLQSVGVVDAFPARGDDALRARDLIRLSIRQHLYLRDRERLRLLSSRAASAWEADETPVGRIEWLYHLLVADPDRGARECESIERIWSRVAWPENYSALAIALAELEAAGLVLGRARCEILFCMASAAALRGQFDKVGEITAAALQLARSNGHESAVARIHCLIGDSLAAQGKGAAALRAYSTFLRLERELNARPTETMIELVDLATALNRVGSTLAEDEKTREQGLELLQEGFTVCERMHTAEPDNPGWKLDLAAASSQLGKVLRRLGRSEEALVCFERDLSICQELVALDPFNSTWQRDLGIAYNRVGVARLDSGQVSEAAAAQQQYLKIFEALVDNDGTNFEWLRELAVAHWSVGIAMAKGGGAKEKGEALRQMKAANECFNELHEISPGSTAEWVKDHRRLQDRIQELEREIGGSDAA